MLLKKRRAICEQLEVRQLLTGVYAVPEVSDIAFTQPLVNYSVQRAGDSGPIGDFFSTAYLDTGTSGNIMSVENATTLGIQNEQVNQSDVLFEDIGVSGQSAFNVSEPLQVGLANFTSEEDFPDSTTPAGTVRFEVNPFPTGDLTGEPIDIIGMPLLAGKVVVMDPKPFFSQDIETLGDMRTFIDDPSLAYDPNNADNPGIPPTSLNVKFSYANFAPYTYLDPTNAIGPTLADNPMIGPNPLRVFESNPPVDNTPPVTMSLNGTTATGSFLFDTGAQGSFMSRAEAAKFGVFYRDNTYGSDAPVLVDAQNNPIANQSVLPFGGLDGNITNVSEFYIDSLSLQTTGGVEIRFLNVPISVIDINLLDANGNAIINPQTQQPFVLDGDFGVNPLLGSMNGGTEPAFNWITFDTVSQTIGFDPSGSISTGSALVSGRHLFYDNSAFDGYVPGISSRDDSAIATDKSALLSSDLSSSFTNISSNPAGITGIMLDISGITGTPTTDDFSFIVRNSKNSDTWQSLATTPTIKVRPGEGNGDSTRIEFTWPAGTIRNEWLQVTVAASGNTGLPAPDTFLFGSLVGSSGQAVGANDTTYTIAAADETAARNDPHGFTSPAPVSNTHDYNRDGRVDITDQLIARASVGKTLVILGTSLFNFSQLPSQAAALASADAAAPIQTAKSAKKSAGNVLVRAQVEIRTRQKAFKLRKQRAILELQRLVVASNSLHNPKIWKQLVAGYKAELTALRATTANTPGALNFGPRML